jgi:hypothetical protein
VEDPIVQKFLHIVLKRLGCQVIEARPRAALELMKTSQPGVGLVITNTPGLFLPFADRVPLLYIAACPDPALASRFRICGVLHKPFHPSELLEAVKALAGSYT